MRFRKGVLIFVALLALLGVGSLFLKPVLESGLEKYLREKMVLSNQSAPMAFEFESLDLNLLGRKLNLHGLRIFPATSADSSEAEANTRAFRKLEIGRVTLHGIDPSHFLWKKQLNITAITLDTVRVLLRKTGAPKPERKPRPAGGAIVDTIQLPGLTDVSLGVFEMDHFQLFLEGPQLDTLVQFTGDQLSLKGVHLSQTGTEENAPFVPVLDSLELELNNHHSVIGGRAYALGYDRFHYRNSGQFLRIDNLVVEPHLEHAELKARHTHSFETYKIKVGSLDVEGFNLGALFEKGELNLKSVTIDSLHAEIFRDKSLPFDTGKTAHLPAQALGAMKFPLRIDTLQVRNSSLKYTENVPATGHLLEVDFADFTIDMYPVVTGAADGGLTDTLHIDVATTLFSALPFEVQLRMPYGHDAIHMVGRSSGSTGLHTLNQTVYPAIEMRFSEGTLKGLFFTAYGNSRHMNGEFTMLYQDMSVEFLNAEGDKKKAMSLLANTLVKSSNPNRHGKTIVGVIDFERIPYKGLGNYVWKSVQSGVVNSMNPVGKHHKK